LTLQIRSCRALPCGRTGDDAVQLGQPTVLPAASAADVRYFDVEPGARVLAHCHWHDEKWAHPTMLVLHGLNASSHAHYMRGIAAKAFVRGMNVVRLNQRNCGDTEHLSAGLFHSGLTADARHVIGELSAVDGISSIVVAGYSLGGNLALKLAGEFGEDPPPVLQAVAAVSPILEVGECVRALERPRNVLYQWNFVRGLKRRMRRKNRFWPGRYDLARLDGVRTVRDFDRGIHRAALRLQGRRRLLLSRQRHASRRSHPRTRLDHHGRRRSVRAAGAFHDPSVTNNPHITLLMCRHGGHCGFVGPRQGNDGRLLGRGPNRRFRRAARQGRG
jgi:predicted alpha/beta-fold hydrolase